MPAIVKTTSALGGGGVALVRFETKQDASLFITVDAEFVALPSAATDRLFLAGAEPPDALKNKAEFVAMLQTQKAKEMPKLNNISVRVSSGLKTITATYTAPVDPTGTIAGGTIITVNTPDGPQQITIGNGSGYFNYTESTAAQSIGYELFLEQSNEVISRTLYYNAPTATLVCNAAIEPVTFLPSELPKNPRNIFVLEPVLITTERTSYDAEGRGTREITRTRQYVETATVERI